jgi:antitoxin HicB
MIAQRCGAQEEEAATMRYPVTLTKDDNDTILVTFPDVPDAVTYGDTRDDALNRAADALLTVFDAYMKDRREIPAPSERRGESVELPALESSKIELYRAMRADNVGKAELARRLDWHLPQVDRVLNVHHGSQIDQLEAAFSALGKKLVVTVIDSEGGSVRRRDLPVASARRHRPVHGAVITNALRQRASVRRASTSTRAIARAVKRAAKKR